jgi:hypothetical protein
MDYSPLMNATAGISLHLEKRIRKNSKVGRISTA